MILLPEKSASVFLIDRLTTLSQGIKGAQRAHKLILCNPTTLPFDVLLSLLVGARNYHSYSGNKMKPSCNFLLLAASCLPYVLAGPIAYRVCQAGCSAVVMACYMAGGATWGATLGATAGPTIIGCNAAYGTCQAACASVLLALTP
ncbi:hypothetical protein LY76DRAFT_554606 [Colletotrichum caudatum]|nr:hypothetical protein LY76DRAFT_554606 [Colletotrichum caudatum]